MKEHEAILQDLRKYLKRRGMESDLDLSKEWYLTVRYGYCYIIFNGHICLLNNEPIVSLADPNYREKFHKFVRDKKNF